jgi:hypothetical protein
MVLWACSEKWNLPKQPKYFFDHTQMSSSETNQAENADNAQEEIYQDEDPSGEQYEDLNNGDDFGEEILYGSLDATEYIGDFSNATYEDEQEREAPQDFVEAASTSVKSNTNSSNAKSVPASSPQTKAATPASKSNITTSASAQIPFSAPKTSTTNQSPTRPAQTSSATTSAALTSAKPESKPTPTTPLPTAPARSTSTTTTTSSALASSALKTSAPIKKPRVTPPVT